MQAQALGQQARSFVAFAVVGVAQLQRALGHAMKAHHQFVGRAVVLPVGLHGACQGVDVAGVVVVVVDKAQLGHVARARGPAVDGVKHAGSGNGGGSGESDSAGNGNGSGDGGGSEVIKIRPNIISSSKPRYPQSARRRGIEGTVLTRILILTDGTVGAAEVVTSSGNSDLDEAALKAVWQWQFSPASNSLGQNVECYTTIPIGFSLS